jgi:hypothetical protein
MEALKDATQMTSCPQQSLVTRAVGSGRVEASEVLSGRARGKAARVAVEAGGGEHRRQPSGAPAISAHSLLFISAARLSSHLRPHPGLDLATSLSTTSPLPYRLCPRSPTTMARLSLPSVPTPKVRLVPSGGGLSRIVQDRKTDLECTELPLPDVAS